MATQLTEPPKEQARAEVTPKQDPFWSLSPFGMTFGRLFDDFWTHRLPLAESGMLAPAMDISETDGEFVVTLELPGIQRDDLKIEFDAGVLRVSGEKKSESEEQQADWHRMERRYGSFCRTLALPSSVDTETTRAELKDGVLTVRLKKTEAARPRSIPIE